MAMYQICRALRCSGTRLKWKLLVAIFAIMVAVGNCQETDTGHSATDATHTPAPAGKSHGFSQVHGSSSHIVHADKTRGGIFIMFCLAVGVITQVLLKHLRLPYTVVLLILGIIFGL